MHKKMELFICFLLLTISINIFAEEPLQPLPQSIQIDQQKADLGERLFFDPRLSKNNMISCATCHDLNQGGASHEKFSIGIYNQVGEVNVPTVYNSSLNFRQFWNGRATSLQQQAYGPVSNPKEMGETWPSVMVKLANDPSYVKMFLKVYGGKITPDNITDAISEYEKSLITPSRFDDYLRGDQKALTEQEKQGYKLFKSYGCGQCHGGVNIGGDMFAEIGIFHDYFKDRGGPITDADNGLYQITKKESDRYVFKIPSLRNIAITAPYMHDGSVKTLNEAVYMMGYYELGIKIPPKDVDAITAFLNSLTGKSLEKTK